MNQSRVLAIETSCDDSSVAIVNDLGFVEALVSNSQEKIHQEFGGVVPEVASRSHSDWLLPLIDRALQESKRTWTDIDAIAVTSRPGLLGALLVGVMTAKTLAFALNKPLISVNHIEGHLMAGFLKSSDRQPSASLTYPFLALAVSGGHTQLVVVHEFGRYEIVGRTRDDAAGEAFDKFAKLIGFGYPGGVMIDKEAQKAQQSQKFEFPVSLKEKSTLDYSFSGLKSAAIRLLEGWSQDKIMSERAQLSRDYQEAIVGALLAKLKLAQKKYGLKQVLITGGVSANSRLRSLAQNWAIEQKIELFVPEMKYCTDNAAMIGWAGIEKFKKGCFENFNLTPSARSLAGDFFET